MEGHRLMHGKEDGIADRLRLGRQALGSRSDGLAKIARRTC